MCSLDRRFGQCVFPVLRGAKRPFGVGCIEQCGVRPGKEVERGLLDYLDDAIGDVIFDQVSRVGHHHSAADEGDIFRFCHSGHAGFGHAGSDEVQSIFRVVELVARLHIALRISQGIENPERVGAYAPEGLYLFQDRIVRDLFDALSRRFAGELEFYRGRGLAVGEEAGCPVRRFLRPVPGRGSRIAAAAVKGLGIVVCECAIQSVVDKHKRAYIRIGKGDI